MTQREFEQIAKELRTTALASARRQLSSAEDAEDTAGDTMLKLWALHDQLNDESHAFRLAKVIAHNTSIDTLKRRQRSRNIFTDVDPTTILSADNSASPQKAVEWKEDEKWLRQRMEKLPPRELQVLQMRQVEHRSNEEIARLMGISEKSVSVMLSTARRKLFNDIKERNRQ